MPYYRIKHRLERKGLLSLYVPVRWFTGRLEFEDDIEADSARDAVLELMRGHECEIDPVAPVRGSAVVGTWFAIGTVSQYIDRFLAQQGRSFAFRSGESVWTRILAVKETDTVKCPICEGTGVYKDTDDVCFACSGDGRIPPEFERRLNRYLEAESGPSGHTEAQILQWAGRMDEIVDELQHGRRTLESAASSQYRRRPSRPAPSSGRAPRRTRRTR